MIRRRSVSVIAVQPAISPLERKHPAHKPVAGSIVQILLQGDSIYLWVRSTAGTARRSPANVGSALGSDNPPQRAAVDGTVREPISVPASLGCFRRSGAGGWRWRSIPKGCKGGIARSTRL